MLCRLRAAARNAPHWIALACACLAAARVGTPTGAVAAPLPSTIEVRLASTRVAVADNAAVDAAVDAVVRSVRDVPDPRRERGVTDLAGMISARARARIERAAARARDETGSVLVVVTVDRIADVGSPKQFATALFNHWRLGPASKNNGVLVLVVRSARRVEIEIGSGLNQAFNRRRWLQRVIDERILPEFKRGNFDGGLEAGVASLADKLRRVDAKLAAAPDAELADAPRMQWDGSTVAVVAFGGLSAVNAYAGMHKCDECNARWSLTKGPFRTTRNATNLRAGSRECTYACKRCGHTGIFVEEIKKYDGMRTRRDGSTYYFYDSGSSDGGSSDGGGAGGSW